jgi:hypothetical protein
MATAAEKPQVGSIIIAEFRVVWQVGTDVSEESVALIP